MTPERRAEIREHLARTRDLNVCLDDWHVTLAHDAEDLLAEVERLRASSELLRNELDAAREQIDQVRGVIEHYIARTRDMDDPDRHDDAEVLRPAYGEVVAMFSEAVGHPPYRARSTRAELEQAVHAYFADADQRGVHLDRMTVTELCDAVMAAIRTEPGR